MPPQPLSIVKPDATVILGNAGHRALSERRDLAVLAMEAIASSSNVDSFLLSLFVVLLGGDASLAARIYLHLETQSAKSAALNEAIGKLQGYAPKYAALVRAIVAISKTNQKARDRLAHHVWGISPDLPDALLLVDPKDIVVGDNLNRDAIYVYQAQHLQDIIAANDRLSGFGLRLMLVFSDHPGNADGRLYDALCKEPEIQERLDRQV